MFDIMSYTEIEPNRQDIDRQSLVIQYDNPSDLSYIKNICHKNRRPNAVSIVNDLIEIDIFIKNDGMFKNDHNYARIIYECLFNNSKPSPFNNRFGNCYIIHVDVEKTRRNRANGVGIGSQDNGRLSQISRR